MEEAKCGKKKKNRLPGYETSCGFYMKKKERKKFAIHILSIAI